MVAPKRRSRAKGSKPKENGRLKAEDIFVRRDADGALQPIEVPVPGLNKTIMVLPTTVGSIKGYTALDKSAAEWPVAEKIRYVIEHVTDPDMSQLEADDISSGMTMWDLDMVLIAAVQGGGVQRSKRLKKV
jgi:hypothetical protein